MVVKKAKERIKELKTKKKALESKKSNITFKIKDIESNLKKIDSSIELEKTNNTIQILEEELKRIQDVEETFERKYEDMNQKISQHEAKLENLVHHKESLILEREIKAKLINEYEIRINLLLKSENKLKNDEIDDLKEIIKSNKEELFHTVNGINESEKQSRLLRTELKTLYLEYDNLKAEKLVIDKNRHRLKKELILRLEEERYKKNQIDRFNNLLKDLELSKNELSKIDSEINETTRLLNELKQEFSLKNQINEIKNEKIVDLSAPKIQPIEQVTLKQISSSVDLPNLSQEAVIHQLEEKIRILEQELEHKDDLHQLEIIKDNMDYTDLIWPLATTYRIATTLTSEKTAKAMNTFNLFEMIAAFNSIVLLSALPTSIYEDERDYLWDDYVKYTKVSFGSWVGLYSRLNKTFKKIKRDEYELLPFKENFYRTITNKDIIKILDPVVHLRNDIVHGGNIDEADAEDAINTLEPIIHKIYNNLMVYSSLELVYPLYMKKKEDENYIIHIKKLEGALYPFSEEDIISKYDMISEVLYLYESETDDRLKLNTNFINLSKCPECWNWSLFIYNKIDKGTAIYKSYQTEKHDHEGAKITINKLLNLPNKEDFDKELALGDYQKLWKIYKRTPSNLSSAEKERLSKYIHDLGYLD